MSFFEISLLAIALAADAFTVGAIVGLCFRSPRQIFRLSFHFGLFQALLPVVGYYAGVFVLSLVETWDHWIVFLVLSSIGLRMILGAGDEKKESFRLKDLTKGKEMVGLSVAVSIDALAAGVGLTEIDIPLYLSVTIIGLVATLATVFAMLMAEHIAKKAGNRVEIVGGIFLIGLGVKTLIEHTLA